MNPDILAQLKDIQLPAHIGLWPLAYGWYIVLALCFIVLYFVVKMLSDYYRRYFRRQKLLQEWQQLALRVINNNLANSLAIDMFIRRVVLKYSKREEFSKLTGREWINYLNQLSAQEKPLLTSAAEVYLCETIFQPPPNFPSEKVLHEIEAWLKEVSK